MNLAHHSERSRLCRIIVRDGADATSAIIQLALLEASCGFQATAERLLFAMVERRWDVLESHATTVLSAGAGNRLS